ncbi:MAG TPA: hypothetical protein VJ891_03075 [Casimicrobiaceae bacterium]|nr:hypothetical protein [Casimicrobiaceae bacterium]
MMKRALQTLLALVLVTVLGVARASTATTEITDMWWNPAESGWGVNVTLQDDIAFLTFFVYDTTNTPIWYTSNVQFQGSDANGALVWTGPLYVTSGPWFGGPFPPANVTIRQAGNASFVLTDFNQATLTYSVDGVVVTKTLQRQTWKSENYTGNYIAGYSITLSSCNPASLDGVQETGGSLAVNHSGNAIAMTSTTAIATCTYNGSYAQTGKLGEVGGTYSCTDGTAGTFSMFEMSPTLNGFTAFAVGQNQFCQWSGSFGGITRAQ